ncbi:MAG: hypothetical protein ABIC82_06310 [bacterium]
MAHTQFSKRKGISIMLRKLKVLSANLSGKFQSALKDAAAESNLEVNILTARTMEEAVKIFKENDLRVIIISVPYIGGYYKESIRLASFFKRTKPKKEIFVLCEKKSDAVEFLSIGCRRINFSVAAVIARLKFLGF